jgi:hypothetical protein
MKKFECINFGLLKSCEYERVVILLRAERQKTLNFPGYGSFKIFKNGANTINKEV